MSASADKSVGLWDADKGKRTKKYTGHSAVVNSVSMAQNNEPFAVSASDDCTAMVWDLRMRQSVDTMADPEGSGFPLTAVSFSADQDYIFTAGIDNVVRAWDRRRQEVAFIMEGHRGLALGFDTLLVVLA